MVEIAGLKETKEAMVGLLKIAALLAEVLKDGAQADDVSVVIAKMMSDETLKAALLEAYNGIDQVPTELGDLSLVEGFSLVGFAVPELMKIILKLKA